MVEYGSGYDDALSNSAISTFLKCGEQYRVLYKENGKRDLPKTLTWATAGIVVHDLIDKYYDKPTIPTTAIVEAMGEYTPNPKELLTFAIKQAPCIEDTQAFAARYGNTYSKPTWSNHYKKNYANLLLEAEKLDALRIKNPLDTFTPSEWAAQILVSLKGFRKLKTSLDKQGYTCHSREGLLKWTHQKQDFAGRYDAILKDKQNNRVLVDWKSGTNSWTPEKIAYHDQLYIYASVLTQQGTPIHAVAIGDLTQGVLVMGDMAHQALAEKRFYSNAFAIHLANHHSSYPIAAGRGDYTCQSCPVRQLKEGCQYAKN
jgi:hypothetical protein